LVLSEALLLLDAEAAVPVAVAEPEVDLAAAELPVLLAPALPVVAPAAVVPLLPAEVGAAEPPDPVSVTEVLRQLVSVPLWTVTMSEKAGVPVLSFKETVKVVPEGRSAFQVNAFPFC